MERFVKGEVVVVWFPFTDLSDSKKRPALVLADLNDIHYTTYIIKKINLLM